MEPEQRGRASRASSTSSLEVRCGCQYYQSDSLLPERRALIGRPPSRTMQESPAVRCSEHDYEPIASPSPQPSTAPVVRISDTDVVPVADSDDSIDDRRRLPSELLLDGDVILPLDGRIEDSAMEGRELVETGDTSEELETAEQLQERLEERFLNAATPCTTESRTDGEVNTSQVDSTTLEELPLRRGARGLHQRIRTQAGKLRSRLRSIQRPTFSFPQKKAEKTRSTSSGRSDKSRTEKRPSRMERIRTSLTERPRFSLPDRPKFSLPERPKFHLPEKAKFSIKRPNIRLPSALTRSKKPPSQQRSTDSSNGARRTIFDFSTYPRIFDKKSKSRGDYATSSPKDSRAESAESATFPRSKKSAPLSARWAQRFAETAHIDEDRPDAMSVAERVRPWRHPSLEEPRRSIRMEEEALQATRAIPWEELQKQRMRGHGPDEEEELRYMDYEDESADTSERQAHPQTQDESSEREPIEIDPRMYGDRVDAKERRVRPPRDEFSQRRGRKDWHEEGDEGSMVEGEFVQIQRSRSLDDKMPHPRENRYEGSFPAVDPRRFEPHKMPSEEDEEEEEEEEIEDTSAPSDKEQQQSSGSSCDRRRRGIIEEIDSDEFFLHERGLDHDDANLRKYLANEIMDALRADAKNALVNDDIPSHPPQRPARQRLPRKRKEGSVESYDHVPPARPKRERGASRRSGGSMDDVFFERRDSVSKHRVVYQTEGSPKDVSLEEPLDDIVIVKPTRRKSKSSLRSQSQAPSELPGGSTQTLPEKIHLTTPEPPAPPTAPSRRKRLRQEILRDQLNGDAMPICNGHREWIDIHDSPLGKPPSPSATPPAPFLKEELRLPMTESILADSQEDIRNLALRLRDEDYIEPVPVPPKRRSRSRTTSVIQDEDRTSHGAESLPEAGYVEEDIPRDEIDSAHDLSGYAIVDKRDKPPRPPPPRRKRRDKFATTPRPTPPKRPQRAYSTLGPAKSRESASVMSESISTTLEPADSTPYIEIDSDEGEPKDLRSGEILSKMQGRPLPAPPRPPRSRKEQMLTDIARSTEEYSTEMTAATQTDPLPDDMVIEEEITQAKLIVAPSRSGSQILVSTERIPTPTQMSIPPVPPLPFSQFLRRDEELQSTSDTASQTAEMPLRDDHLGERHLHTPEQMHLHTPERQLHTPEERHLRTSEERHLRTSEERHLHTPVREESIRLDEAQLRSLRTALLPDDTLRIGSLEVGDLKVDRLSVSQLEAHKIVASEIDALMISASEVKTATTTLEDTLSPSIIKELIAIRSHLESVATSQMQDRCPAIGTRESESKRTVDIPSKVDQASRDERSKETTVTRTASDRPVSAEPEKFEQRSREAVESTSPEAADKRVSASLHTQTMHDTRENSLRVSSSDLLLPSSKKNISDSDADDSNAALLVSDVPVESKVSSDSTLDITSCVKLELMEPDMAYSAGTKEDTPESSERKKQKSRSPSPSSHIICPVRQTASPVRSLPPVISVTPDTPDVIAEHATPIEAQPQRAVISYSEDVEQSQTESQRETSQLPPSDFPVGTTHFIAFPASQIPSQFFSLTAPSSSRADQEPSVIDTTQQLLRVLRLAGAKAMRHFVGYLADRVGRDDSREKIREVELALCALLLLIAGLLIICFSSSRTIMHYHHWDYFNPPQ